MERETRDSQKLHGAHIAIRFGASIECGASQRNMGACVVRTRARSNVAQPEFSRLSKIQFDVLRSVVAEAFKSAAVEIECEFTMGGVMDFARRDWTC